MGKLLTHLLNVIFPPRPTEKIIQETNDKQIVNLYNPKLYKTYIHLSEYKNSTIRSIVVENKFHRNSRASNLLGKLLDEWSKEQSFSTLYIPIPLGPKRQKQRGYNQVENILKNTDGNLRINSRVLKRTLDTEPQMKLDKQHRLKNMSGAFVCNEKEMSDLKDFKQIVIVDDVTTTGTTLLEAKTTLEKSLPNNITVKCLALAH